MRRRENPVHHHGAQQPEPAAVDRIQARTQVDSAALSRPPDLMKPFATLAPAERALVINEAAGRLGLVPLIVEKDFWVCWTLARIFETPALVPHLVFKGGTSLSKVFGAIQRFSEDIDLAVSAQALGFTAAELDEAPSASQRRKRGAGARGRMRAARVR